MKIIKFILLVLLFCQNELIFSQNYSFQKELGNRVSKRNLQRFLREQKLDSLQLTFKEYDNRLGFFFYQCQAIIYAKNHDSLSKFYLDTAFRRGLTPLCLGKNKMLFDSIQLQSSFQSNYLKDYNLTLINRIDSMHYKDQEYRQKVTELMRLDAEENNIQKQVQTVERTPAVQFASSSYQTLVDSLWSLQNTTDSTNMILLNQIIEMYGWPSAKLIGHYYCQRPAADVSTFIMHLGTKKRDYQISTLKSVIRLCILNEESWGVAENLMYNLHSRFRNEYSEWSFIFLHEGVLDFGESFFSIYSMASLLITHPESKMEIKCKNQSLFNEITSQMVAMNKYFLWTDYQKSNRPTSPLSKKLFVFKHSPEMNQNEVLYRFISSNR